VCSSDLFIHDKNLMAERTHLPDLDYKKLAIDGLSRFKKADKAPTGRYDSLVKYLQARGSAVDAAEVDRRLRTWFEDIITQMIANPASWDADRILDGKAMMDFISGVQSQPAAPAPKQPGGPA
jgi:hypothetical protein